ncbi:hypothetical protein ACFSC4_30305 [Deinococcus malanensis]|uniref:hypothetical protein n=1 Tax=Deinococcus malanensis TaxID=1706855 RepID=UPI0036284B4F
MAVPKEAHAPNTSYLLSRRHRFGPQPQSPRAGRHICSRGTHPPAGPSDSLVKYCAVQIIRDNALIFAYKPVIRLHPSCSRRAQARVRKSSTLNTRRNGAPYQPIRPEKGAWTVTASGTTIPNRDLWTTWSWRWEYWDGTHWRPAEVL